MKNNIIIFLSFLLLNVNISIFGSQLSAGVGCDQKTKTSCTDTSLPNRRSRSPQLNFSENRYLNSSCVCSQSPDPIRENPVPLVEIRALEGYLARILYPDGTLQELSDEIADLELEVRYLVRDNNDNKRLQELQYVLRTKRETCYMVNHRMKRFVRLWRQDRNLYFCDENDQNLCSPEKLEAAIEEFKKRLGFL